MMNAMRADLAAAVLHVEQHGDDHPEEELRAHADGGPDEGPQRRPPELWVLEPVDEVAQADELRQVAELVRAEERHHENVDDGIEHERDEEDQRSAGSGCRPAGPRGSRSSVAGRGARPPQFLLRDARKRRGAERPPFDRDRRLHPPGLVHRGGRGVEGFLGRGLSLEHLLTGLPDLVCSACRTRPPAATAEPSAPRRSGPGRAGCSRTGPWQRSASRAGTR